MSTVAESHGRGRRQLYGQATPEQRSRVRGVAVFVESATSLTRLLRLPVTTRCWRLDRDRFAGVEHSRGTGCERLDRSILSAHRVLAHLSGFAALQSKRTNATVT